MLDQGKCWVSYLQLGECMFCIIMKLKKLKSTFLLETAQKTSKECFMCVNALFQTQFSAHKLV